MPAASRALRPEEMTPEEQDAALAAIDAELDARKREHPLAYAKLWHSEKTSQREAIRCEFDPRYTEVWNLGGNRSGKSEGDAMVDVVYALGRDHPDSQAWAKLNGIDISIVQPGPGLVYNGALTFADSRRYVRPKIQKYCPEGTKYRAWGAELEGEAILPNGGRIVCKAVRQGRKGWQGDACHRVRFDEEPDDMEVVHEAMVRLVDFGGKACFSMTPLSGWTELLTEHVEVPDPDVAVNWLHGADNPHIPTENLERIMRKFGAHEQGARRRGEIVALEGRIYTEWSRALHIVPGFPIPPEWPWARFAGWDFGTRNPTAIAWLAHDPADDVIHVYREHYKAGKPLQYHAMRFHQLSGNDWDPDRKVPILLPDGQALGFVCADSAGADQRIQLLEYGITTVASLKGPGSVRDGINRVAARLAPDAEGRPHLVVHDCCTHFVKEIESYRWDPTKRQGDMADQPLKKDDHLMDASRYALTYFERKPPPPPEPEEIEDFADDIADLWAS